MEEGGEGGVLEEVGVVAHEDVYVACFDVLVGPDYGVVAHLDGGVRGIGLFVDAGEDVDVRARGLTPGVPLLVLDGEGWGKVFHCRMGG